MPYTSIVAWKPRQRSSVATVTAVHSTGACCHSCSAASSSPAHLLSLQLPLLGATFAGRCCFGHAALATAVLLPRASGPQTLEVLGLHMNTGVSYAQPGTVHHLCTVQFNVKSMLDLCPLTCIQATRNASSHHFCGAECGSCCALCLAAALPP